ncbi:hypothetical protein [Chryseobacterium sp.]
MVKRKILEEMSNEELLEYINSESRFVYEAIEMSYDILIKRGFYFSDADKSRIEKLIEIKKEKEAQFKKVNTWDVNTDDESSNLEFYSQKSIWYFSVFFGVHSAAILLAINLFIISKSKKAWGVILFGCIYSLLIYLAYKLFRIYIPDYYFLILIFMTAGGAAILQFYFWDNYLANIKYKKKSIIAPLLICIILHFLIFIILFF